MGVSVHTCKERSEQLFSPLIVDLAESLLLLSDEFALFTPDSLFL